MKPDRPLLVSIVCIAAGLFLTFAYCQGTAGLSAGFPVSSSTIRFAATTNGPAALGGILLTAVGVVLMVWSFLLALFGQIALLMDHAGNSKGPERLFGYEQPSD